jgi:LysR family transcriptional regulator, glycine cleavage system transcriptional activator
MRRPRLNVLRSFEAAGRRLSFSLAADELNVSQAAVSQQMRHLEAYLDTELFIRKHRRISLTRVGQSYFNAVHEALERLDTVTDQLFPDRAERAVSIRCTSSVATLWLAPAIHDFHAGHPEIDLHIHTLEPGDAGNTKDHSDFEIFVSPHDDHGPDVRALLSASIVPVAAPDYLARNRPRQPGDLRSFNLIHILGYDDDWHRWFRTFGPPGQQIPRGLAADSSLFAIDAALRGDGIFLGRRPFIDGYLASGDLVEVFDPPQNLFTTYFLRFRKTRRTTASQTLVLDWLLGLVRTG